jgi:hypothetical protein
MYCKFLKTSIETILYTYSSMWKLEALWNMKWIRNFKNKNWNNFGIFWNIGRVFKTLRRSNLLMPKLFQNCSIIIGQSGQNVLSTLDLVDKRKCHCRTKWQHRVEWLRLVKNLNSCSLWEIMKDFKERSFEFVIIKTYSSFENEDSLMIGVREEFWWRKTLILHCIFFLFFFSILCCLNLFSYYCRYCIVVTMGFGKVFVWIYFLICIVDSCCKIWILA